jgi:hypothetical protein
VFRLRLFETKFLRKSRQRLIYLLKKTIGIFLVLFVCFFMRKLVLHDKTKHLNPSPWQCYSLCWRMRHEQKSSGDANGGEGRGKATA